MNFNIVKLLFLMGFSILLTSCGGNNGSTSQSQNQGSLIEEGKSGLKPSIYKLLANSDLTIKQKNAAIGAVKAAIDANQNDKAKRATAVAKAIKDNGGQDALAKSVSDQVDVEHQIGPQKFPDNAPDKFSPTTFTLLKSLANDDDADGVNTKLNQLLAALVDVYGKNYATNAERGAEILRVVIPAGITLTHAQIRQAMEDDKDLGTGGAVALEGPGNLDKDVHDLFTALSGVAVAADKDAINTALNNVLNPLKTILDDATITTRQARETAIDALPVVAGLDVAVLKDRMQDKHPLIDDEAKSGLKQVTYLAVKNTANANMDVKKRNQLMPLVLAATNLGTTTARNDDVHAAIRTVRGLAAAAVLAGEDADLATAIKTAILADYPIVPIDCATIKMTFDANLCAAVNGLARTVEQRNGIIEGLKGIEKLAPAAVAAKVTAVVTPNGGADAGNVVLNAVTAAYFPASLGAALNFNAAGLDLLVYAAIRDAAAPVTDAIKQAAVPAVQAVMNARPRAATTLDRDNAINAAITGIAGGVNVSTLVITVNTAANEAQPIVALTAKDAAMDQRVYNAIVGGAIAGATALPLSISNARMNAALPLVLAAQNARPRVQATRDDALRTAVRTALGLDAAAVLDAANNVDAFNWFTRIKGEVDTLQAAAALTDRNDATVKLADARFDGIYNAIVGDLNASNAQMNTMLAAIKVVLDAPANRDENARLAAIKVAVCDSLGLGGADAGAKIGLVDADANALAWATAIANSSNAYFGENIIARKDASLNGLKGKVYDEVLRFADPSATNAQVNTLLNALAAALGTEAKVATGILLAARDAVDAFPWDGASADIKVNNRNAVKRFFNNANHKDLDPAARYSAEVYDVKGDGLVLKDAKNNYFFLPENMTAGLPVEKGDTVYFNDISATKDYVVSAGVFGIGGTKANTITAPIVDMKN